MYCFENIRVRERSLLHFEGDIADVKMYSDHGCLSVSVCLSSIAFLQCCTYLSVTLGCPVVVHLELMGCVATLTFVSPSLKCQRVLVLAVLLLLLQPFNDPLSSTTDPLSSTTQVSRYQKDKPFWILLKQT